MKGKYLLWGILLLGLLAPGLVGLAQTGSQHGVNVKWTVPSPVGGSGTVQGYYVFRCPGTCTASSTGWASLTSGVIAGTSYEDAATNTNGPAPSTTYSYAALTVDSNGNESSFSNVATVTTPSSWATNPNPPGGCSATNN